MGPVSRQLLESLVFPALDLHGAPREQRRGGMAQFVESLVFPWLGQPCCAKVQVCQQVHWKGAGSMRGWALVTIVEDLVLPWPCWGLLSRPGPWTSKAAWLPPGVRGVLLESLIFPALPPRLDPNRLRRCRLLILPPVNGGAPQRDNRVSHRRPRIPRN